MGNLAVRLLSALVLAPLLVLLIWEGPVWGWAALMVVATALATWELADFSQPKGALRERVAIVAGAAAVCATVCLRPGATGLAIALCAMAIATTFLVRFGEVNTAAQRMALGIAAALLVALPLGLLGRVRALTAGSGWVTLCLLATWFGDTGAYFFGKYLGKGGKKLYPAVSPNKTWIGVLGGFVGAALAGVLAGAWFLRDATSTVSAIVVAIAITPAGVVGDLVESLWKRTFGVKDSGALIPGHGGMLDRIDAILFTAPVLYWLATTVVPWIDAGLSGVGAPR